jgi:hypothetical protein
VLEVRMHSAARSPNRECLGKLGHSALPCGLKVINVQHEDPSEFGNRHAVVVGVDAAPLLDNVGVCSSAPLPRGKRGVSKTGIGRRDVYATADHRHCDFFEFCGVIHLTLFPNPLEIAAKQERVSDLLRARNRGDAGKIRGQQLPGPLCELLLKEGFRSGKIYAGECGRAGFRSFVGKRTVSDRRLSNKSLRDGTTQGPNSFTIFVRSQVFEY